MSTLPAARPGQHFGDFFLVAKAAQHLDVHRKRSEAALERFEVLEGEHRGGREHGDLFAVAQRLERSAHRDFGFAVADVAAQQPVHRMAAFHVFLDLLDGGELVLGLGEVEGVLEFALPVAVVRKCEALGHLALRIKLEQLVGHVAHLGFDARLGARPRGAAQPVERRSRAFARAAILLDQVETRERNVELRLGGVLDQHEVAFVLALRDLARAHEAPDAVRDVHHVVARLQIREVSGEGGQLRLGWAGLGDQLGGVEQIFGAEQRDARVGETPRRAAPVP